MVRPAMLTVTVDDGAATIAAAAITSRSAACMMLLQVTLVSTVASPATPPGKGLKTALNVMLTCLTVVLGKCLPL